MCCRTFLLLVKIYEVIEDAIINYWEDLEDTKDTQERLSNPPKLYFTLEEMEKKLGLVD